MKQNEMLKRQMMLSCITVNLEKDEFGFGSDVALKLDDILHTQWLMHRMRKATDLEKNCARMAYTLEKYIYNDVVGSAAVCQWLNI